MLLPQLKCYYHADIGPTWKYEPCMKGVCGVPYHQNQKKKKRGNVGSWRPKPPWLKLSWACCHVESAFGTAVHYAKHSLTSASNSCRGSEARLGGVEPQTIHTYQPWQQLHGLSTLWGYITGAEKIVLNWSTKAIIVCINGWCDLPQDKCKE